MKRLITLCILLLTFSAPALAQNTTGTPAAYLPSDVPAYIELRTDSAGLDAYNQLMTLSFQLSGTTNAPADVIDTLLTPTLSSTFPGIDVHQDVLPWLGDEIGLAQINLSASDPSQPTSGQLIVLPIGDNNAAQAFITKFSAGAAPQPVAEVNVYKINNTELAIGTDVIWFGDAPVIDSFLKSPMFQRLTDNPRYQKVRAALPADAAISAYVSGNFLTSTLAEMQNSESSGMPPFAAVLEAALRIHPAQSAAEDALLKSPNIDGIGVALQVSSGKIDATAILSLDAQYPAPTLTTKTAGTALLSLIPGDSFVVFDSYDLSATAPPVAALTYLGPTIGSTFNSIVVSLDTGEVLPTPTPTPSPTPAPPLTADALMAQMQPILAQAQSTMGLSLDQLYSLIDGEYAIAVFPGLGPTLGEALYLQSSDPQKIIDTLDHVSKLILTDPTAGTQLITLSHSTVDGVNVVLIDGTGMSDRPALGILDNNVLFLTTESAVSKVIEAAKTQSPAPPALNFRDSFGDSQEALLYLDPRTIDLYSLRAVRNPLLPISALAGSFDVRDNGLFVLHLTATIGS